MFQYSDPGVAVRKYQNALFEVVYLAPEGIDNGTSDMVGSSGVWKTGVTRSSRAVGVKRKSREFRGET